MSDWGVGEFLLLFGYGAYCYTMGWVHGLDRAGRS